MPLVDSQAIAADWTAALGDAELDPDDCRLMCLSAGDEEPTSGHFPPGRTLVPDELLDADVAATLNEPANIDKHRVVVVRDAPPGDEGRALVAAKMRHELEHARQWNAVGEVAQRLSCIVDQVIKVVADGFDDAGRASYHAQPNERDASAAASRFVRDRFAAEAIDAIATGRDAFLVSAQGPPEPLETLPSRNVKFLFQYADVCTTVPGFEDELEEIAPAMLEHWRELERQQAGESKAEAGT